MNHLIAALRPEARAALERQLNLRTLKQGTIVAEQNEPIDRVTFAFNGMISSLAVMEDGSQVETAMIGNEGGYGLTAGLAPGRSFGRGIVQIEGVMGQVEASRFRVLVAQHDDLRSMIERHTEYLWGECQQTAACNALHQIEQRLSRWLLQAQDRTHVEVLYLTQEFLGEMMGAQRTTVTQVAGELQRLGLIRYQRGKVTVVDRDGLKRSACECYAGSHRRLLSLIEAGHAQPTTPVRDGNGAEPIRLNL